MTTPRTTADLLVDMLIQWGIDVIYGLPCDGINGIVEACAHAVRYQLEAS